MKHWRKCKVVIVETEKKLTQEDYEDSLTMVLLNGKPYYMESNMIGDTLTTFQFDIIVDQEPQYGDYIIDDDGVYGPWELDSETVGKCQGIIIASLDATLGVLKIKRSFIDAYFEAGRPEEIYVLFIEVKGGNIPNYFIPFEELNCVSAKLKHEPSSEEQLIEVAKSLLFEFDDHDVLMNTPIAYHRKFEKMREILNEYKNDKD